MTDEEAKAAQEIAKVTGRSLDSGERVMKFFRTFIGEAPEELGETVTAWTRYFKFKNFLAIHDKVEAIVAKRKCEGKMVPIPARIGIPLLEAATQENDETLQNKWAALIANAADPKTAFQIRKVFVSLLAELEPLDAAVLDVLPNAVEAVKCEDRKNPLFVRVFHGLKVPELSERLSASEDDILLSLHNLIRLGCVGYSRDTNNDMSTTWGFGLPSKDLDASHWATDLGDALRCACRQ